MIPILPDLTQPRITLLPGAAGERAARGADALLAIAPPDARAAAFASLPEPRRWRGLHERAPARPGTVRSTTLANARQTLAVLGYLDPQASAFERLALAGKLMKEAAAREPVSIVGASLAVGETREAQLEALLAAALAHAFRPPSWRSRAAAPAPRLERIALADTRGSDIATAPRQARIAAAARANNLARWLTALPPNVLDARRYRAALARLARRHRLAMRWIGERELKRLGAHAFLAVSAGNADRSAGIAHLSYRPGGRRRPGGSRPEVTLVGKGILFDTGGNNLKAHRGMLDMHIDMAGSAVAVATLVALAELRAPIAVDAWLAISENRIGPTAYRPQDVVRAANGLTIQVIHTDAEGRMVLADTLALASRDRPKFMIDFATLTGACVQALTERMSGVFTNCAAALEPLLAAGRASGERVWNFPLDADYDSDLESKVADVVQCALEGKGDHILAARFLKRFVADAVPWAHVDLSAAMRSGGLAHIGTDVTGFGVRYALELLLGQGLLEALDASR